MGAVVLTLALREQLSTQGYYWYNLPKSEGYPFLALVEHTNFLSPQYFGGDHIVYCGDYLDPNHEYFRLSKEALLERFLPALARINPDFSPIGSATPGCGAPATPNPSHWSTTLTISPQFKPPLPVCSSPA